MKFSNCSRLMAVASVSSAIFAILSTVGCGGSSTTTCDTVQGQFAGGAQNARRTIIVYALNDCDAAGNNCQQTRIAQTTTDENGKFRVSGLKDGKYLAVLYDPTKNAVVDQRAFSTPDICGNR